MRKLALSIFVAALAVPVAEAANPFEHVQLDPQQRAQQMLTLPGRLADFAADEAVIACFYATEIGDDASVLALDAIDRGRRVIKEESDRVLHAYARGATPRELLSMRKKLAATGRAKVVANATQLLQDGQDYCEAVRKALDEEKQQ